MPKVNSDEASLSAYHLKNLSHWYWRLLEWNSVFSYALLNVKIQRHFGEDLGVKEGQTTRQWWLAFQTPPFEREVGFLKTLLLSKPLESCQEWISVISTIICFPSRKSISLVSVLHRPLEGNSVFSYALLCWNLKALWGRFGEWRRGQVTRRWWLASQTPPSRREVGFSKPCCFSKPLCR